MSQHSDHHDCDEPLLCMLTDLVTEAVQSGDVKASDAFETVANLLASMIAHGVSEEARNRILEIVKRDMPELVEQHLRLIAAEGLGQTVGTA